MADEPDLDSAYALETPDDNRKLYKNWAETYDADFVEGAGFRFPRLVAEAFNTSGQAGPVLDVGCGTGAVAMSLRPEVEVDGLDLSSEMLAVAQRKGRYRDLIEANLKEPLPLPDGVYGGLTSSGTFTHGHVGAEALDELVRVLAPGAFSAISVRDMVWDSMGFHEAFQRLTKEGAITPPERAPHRIYESADTAPEGHAEDIAYLTTFRRL